MVHDFETGRRRRIATAALEDIRAEGGTRSHPRTATLTVGG